MEDDFKKEKICEFCGKPFIPKTASQKYCKEPHYMNCPVCGKRYLVTNDDNLKRPPVACSYACRVKRTQETSMKKYGMKAPGNNPEAREKAKATMQKKFGVDYAMQSPEIYRKGVETLQRKYGVDNIKKLKKSESLSTTIKDKFTQTILTEFPLKTLPNPDGPLFRIEEEHMQVYVLKERASVEFLKRYGQRVCPKFGKIHTSVGLVDDGILYQVLRFERKQGVIYLADFGTRGNYMNPNYYSKLMGEALNTIGIDSFKCVVPRSLASPELLKSLSVKLVKEGMYDVYWRLEEGLRKVNSRDNVIEMKKRYDYITTDYLDEYEYTNEVE